MKNFEYPVFGLRIIFINSRFPKYKKSYFLIYFINTTANTTEIAYFLNVQNTKSKIIKLKLINNILLFYVNV